VGTFHFPNTPSRADAALRCASFGWQVLPLHELVEDGCSCGRSSCPSPGKHPRTPHGLNDATSDPVIVAKWWRRWSNANIGLRTGIGFDVLDLDGDDGLAWLAEMEAIHGPLPAGLRAKTGRGGLHIFLKRTGHGNAAHIDGRKVDFRGTGGYVVVAPSVTVAPYEWIGDPSVSPIPEAPERLLVLLRKPEAVPPTIEGTIPQGSRNEMLFQMARGLAASGAAEEVILTALRAIRDQHTDPGDDPVGDDELLSLARQGIKYQRTLGQPGDDEAAAPDDAALAVDGRDEALEPPDPEAFDGLLGEIVRLHEGHTTASPVALLATAVAVTGALIPGRVQYHGWQTSSVYVAIVADTGGGKGTALDFIGEAMAAALGDWDDRRLDGVNSGEALIRDLSVRQHGTTDRKTSTTPAEPFVPCAAILIEEELASLFARGRREGSTLDTEVRKAFDGRTLSTGKSESRATVRAPYYLTAIGHITDRELQHAIASISLTNGSANRWLWLPVSAVDGVADGEFPAIPGSVVKRLGEAYRWASSNHAAGVRLTPGAKALADGYRAFLVRLPGSHDLTVRLHIIALRIALIHALVNGERGLTARWVRSGVALTEYARSGLASVFGRMTGTPEADLLARRLQAAGRLNGREQRAVIFDPVKRQAAADRLQSLRVAVVERTSGPRGGRPSHYLVWTGLTSGSARFEPEVRGVGGVGAAIPHSDDDGENAESADLSTNLDPALDSASRTYHQPSTNPLVTPTNQRPASLWEIRRTLGGTR
jgi:hypothetical protein